MVQFIPSMIIKYLILILDVVINIGMYSFFNSLQVEKHVTVNKKMLIG